MKKKIGKLLYQIDNMLKPYESDIIIAFSLEML